MWPRLSLVCNLLIHSVVKQIFNRCVQLCTNFWVSHEGFPPCLKMQLWKMSTWALGQTPPKSLKGLNHLPPCKVKFMGLGGCVVFIILILLSFVVKWHWRIFWYVTEACMLADHGFDLICNQRSNISLVAYCWDLWDSLQKWFAS